MIFTCIALASFDAQAKELQTRVEVNTRLGTERSIAMTELWHPLAQDYGRVLYTDLRIMGDNDSNSEFNIGLGHRHITNNGSAILGVNGWLDRRQTERGSVFYQTTAGYEYLTIDNDLRINAYLPFNQEEKYTLPFTGSTAPYLAGTGIFYDTNGSLVERPMKGFDVELGHKFTLPLWPETSFRAAAGGFHFSAQEVKSVTGGRLKLTADINSDFQVGARFENDSVRGSQGFIEATLRFPFGAKAANDTLAIRNRLDESPERDIDIISGNQIDTGRMKPVISAASGQAQRVFYVDNTAAAGGNGSIDNPFNNLAAANAAITQAGDIIYVYSGDGTTNNYDTHVELTRTGQALIGSGSAFIYDAGRFSATNDAAFNGTTLLAAGARPTITNTLGTCDVGNCGAVYVNADDVLLSGFTAANALNNGIDVYDSRNTTITNVTTEDNAGYGLYIGNFDGETRSFALDGFSSSGNGLHGFQIEANGAGSTWDGVTLNNLDVSDNLRGIFFQSTNSGTIRNISVTNSNVINHSAEGFAFNAPNGTIENVTLDNLYAENNFNGLTLQTGGIGTINTVDVENFVITQSTASGIDIRGNTAQAIENININNVSISGGTGSSNAILLRGSGTVRDVNITNSTLTNNPGAGIALTATHLNNIAIDNVTANNNQNGFTLTTANGSTRDNIIVTNFTANNNSQSGFSVSMSGTGALTNSINISNSTANNNTTGISVSASASVLSNVTFDTINLDANTTGASISASATGTVSNATLNNLTITNSTGNGINVASSSSGTITNLAITNLALSNSGANGINMTQTNSSTQNGTSMSNVTVSNSSGIGLNVSTISTGSINNLQVNNSRFTNGGGAGVYLRAQNTTGFSGSMAGSTVTGNATNGIYVDDDTTGVYTFDLGGGGLSAGNNRIFGNTGTELRVDLDGGVLKAENNWWGNAAGLLPAETTLEVGSTVDSTPFLNADPGP